MLYKDFEQKYLWKRIDYDKSYGYQCVDLARQYSIEVFRLDTGSFWGSAWTGWQALSKDKRFHSYTRTSKFTIPPIWSMVFFPHYTMGQEYGHVGICAYAQMGWDKIDILEQNGATGKWWGTGWDAIRIATYRLSQVRWWIIPKK